MSAQPVRLVARIYLLALITLLLIGVVLVLVSAAPRPPEMQNLAGLLADELGARHDDPPALQARADEIHRRLGASIALHDLAGRRLASAGALPEVPLAALRGEGEPLPPHAFSAPAHAGGVVVGHGLLNTPPPTFPATFIVTVVGLVLGGLAVASVLVARSVARPLARLGAAARALGAGDLDARVGAMPRGELGELARAFDEMATRVQTLLQAQRDLLVGVSHELRTPLARLRVAVDLGREGDVEALDGLGDDLVQLERLVGDLLTATSLELTRGAAPSLLRRAPVELGELLARAAAGFRAAFTDHPLTLTGADDPVEIVADAGLLRRVVDNLLDNARKYSEAGRPIALRLLADASSATIEVVDRGIGIEAHDLAQLGTPFFRGERSRARSTGGVGLGLTLVRRIVEAHEGTLLFASDPHRGTQVRVTLPRPHRGPG